MVLRPEFQDQGTIGVAFSWDLYSHLVDGCFLFMYSHGLFSVQPWRKKDGISSVFSCLKGHLSHQVMSPPSRHFLTFIYFIRLYPIRLVLQHRNLVKDKIQSITVPDTNLVNSSSFLLQILLLFLSVFLFLLVFALCICSPVCSCTTAPRYPAHFISGFFPLLFNFLKFPVIYPHTQRFSP